MNPGDQIIQMIAPKHRLRKHAEYQLVYKSSRKQFTGQTSYFFRLRRPSGPATSPENSNSNSEAPRIGLTVGKALGKAVDRNCIKRRLRAAVRSQLPLLSTPVDVVLHPKRSVIDLDFPTLEREIAAIFRAIQHSSQRQLARAPASAE
jgi:ribonuclease P protein component